MEYENEENRSFMDYTEDGEQQEESVNNFSYQSINAEDQIQENFNNISVQSINQANESIEEFVEPQQPLYKLNNVDTESSVKIEIKQSILTRVSDETTSRILNDKWFEINDQIENLTTQTVELSNKNQELGKEIEADETRLAQSAETLSKTDEMIVLLKKDLGKLDVHQKESFINKYLEKSIQQMEKLKALKEIYISKLKSDKKTIENLETTKDDQNEKMKSDLTYKSNALNSLKKKQIELEQLILSCVREIEYRSEENNVLQEKLTSITNNKENVNNKFSEQTDVIYSKNKNQVDRLNNLNEMKRKLEQDVGELVNDLDRIGADMDNEKQISEEQMRKSKLETLKLTSQDVIQNLHQNYTNVDKRLNEVLSAVTNCNAENDDLLIKMRSLNAEYVRKIQEKSVLTEEILKRQNSIHNIKMEMLKKKTENEVQQKRVEQLRKEYETTGILLNSLKDDITKEKENVANEITQLKSKLISEQSFINKCSLEIKEKKEYVLANAKYFLQEKSENLQKEVNEIEHIVKNLENDKTHIKVLLERKQLHLNELNKSFASKQKQESTLKSGFKMPNKTNIVKKVKFNEVVSFKSTSSDSSSVPVEDVTPHALCFSPE